MMQTNRRLPLTRIALLLLLVLQAALYGLIWYRLLGDRSLWTMDFISFYSAGRLARAGESASVYDVDALTVTQQAVLQSQGYITNIFNHPPYLLPVLALLAVDDYVLSYILWSLIRLIPLLACGWLIQRFLLRSGWDAASAWLGALGCILFYPLFLSLLGGQDTVFTLLGLLVWMFAFVEGRHALSGLGLALASLVPSIGGALALPWILSQRRKAVPFLVGGLGLGLYTLLLIGVDGIRNFVRMLGISSQSNSYGLNPDAMYNLLGILRRALPSMPLGTARLVAWAVVGLIILVLCVSWWRLGRLQPEHMAIAVLGVTFASPHLHVHTLSVLILPLLCLLVVLWSRGRHHLALLFIPALSTFLLLLSLLKPGWDYPFYYGLMALLAAALTWSLRAPSALPAPREEPDRQREARA